MTFDPKVKDDDILAGFASLHQAMAEGFDRMERKFAKFEHELRDVRGDVARLETRMLRRFDEVDERFAQVDVRFAQVDARFAQVDARFDKLEARFDKLEARVMRIEDRTA